MKIQILNKNLTSPNDYSSSKVFDIDEGAILTLCKNETLDSATIRISNQTKKIEIEPFDMVILSDMHLSDRKMLVDTFVETITCLNPKIYTYEIQLFSLTKELENYLCPNLKITKVFGETRYVYEYLEEYLTEYGPYIRVIDGVSYRWTKKYPLSQHLIDRFNYFTIEAPEMQWNQPTLREVLNNLLMVDDCIVIINQDLEIDYMDLTEIGDDISSDENINYITSSRSSEDYVSELKANLVNVTNPRDDEILNTTTRAEWFSIYSNEAIITSDNWLFKTQYPIYNIKKLKIMFPWYFIGDGDETQFYWVESDLNNIEGIGSLIFEYKEWITKEIKYKFPTGLPSFNEWYKYQNLTIHYSRGGNEISGFNTTLQSLIGSTKYIDNLEHEIALLNEDNIISGIHLDAHGLSRYSVDEESLFIYIEYETLQECVFKASKGEKPNHAREVIDNQTNSYIDSYNQGFLEYQKANRLGNHQLRINARYTDFTDVLDLSDYYEDNIIYQVQYQIYKNHIEVNAVATKNYILRNYFTGVKAKLRSWKIADGSEALTRHDLIKYYFEFSFTDYNETHGLSGVVLSPYYLLSPVYSSSNIKPIKYVAVRTTAGTPDIYPSETEWYAIDLVSRFVGNSLVFSFAFQDNYWVDKHIDTDITDYASLDDSVRPALNATGHAVRVGSSGRITGGIPTQYYRYTDDNGENRGGEIYLLNNLIITNKKSGDIADDNDSKSFYIAAYDMPKVSNSAIADGKVLYTSFTFIKDSQEITSLSIQLELTSDTTDISFTKDFLRRQEAIRTIDNVHTFTIKSSTEYNFRRIELPDDAEAETELSFTVGGDGSLTIRTVQTYGTAQAAKTIFDSIVKDKALYIVDENDVVLLAINNAELRSSTYLDVTGYRGAVIIYLNILRDRNKDIYESQQNQTFKKTI